MDFEQFLKEYSALRNEIDGAGEQLRLRIVERAAATTPDERAHATQNIRQAEKELAKVCDRWRERITTFINDLGERVTK